jgi:F-type H+-transporting ATPase subunit b
VVSVNFIKRIFLLICAFAIIPTISFAAYESPSISGFFYRLLVFVVFVGLLYKLLGQRVKDGLTSGVDATKKAIEDAEKANSDAKAELAEYSRKIADMHIELGKMKDVARKTAEKEAEHSIKEAERSGERLKSIAKRTIEAEFEKTMVELGREHLVKAIDGAEAIIVADNDVSKKQTYMKESINKIGA